MRVRRVFLGCCVAAVITLIAATLTAAQSPAGQSGPERAPMSEEVLRNVQMLRGIPVDTFFEAMGMFASAMGEDCTYCHVSRAYFDKSLFATPTARIQRARQMIGMVNALNKQYFGGQPRVTCYTCHPGTTSPRQEPDFAIQYGQPYENPNASIFPVDDDINASQVFDAYLKAVGGAERVGQLTSYTAKGTYAGYDTGLAEVPIELYGRAPAQQTMVVHFSTGASTRVFDGQNGWMAGPDTPLPLLTLTGGNLDRARLEAMVEFPIGFRAAYPEWKAGRTVIDDKDVTIVQGRQNGQPAANFYFDDDDLLVRIVRWTQTPVGLVPTQIDYSDYKTVAGVKIPFERRVRQTYMQMTVKLADMQPNASVAPNRFARPAPADTRGVAR